MTDTVQATPASMTSVGGTWPRPLIVPLPKTTAGVQSPVIPLSGTWKLHTQPPKGFWTGAINPASWRDVPVPSDLHTSGIDIPEGQEYAYAREVEIPADFAGQRIFLRFDGVTGHARLWVNGQPVREHDGGFTSWYADITDLVTPGQAARLTVGVVNTYHDVSPFNIGGMIREAWLVAVPPDYLTRLIVETDLDAAYRDATLYVTAAMSLRSGQSAQIRLTLTDPWGQRVALNPATIALSGDQAEAHVAIPVKAPAKWDAEHPNLYRLDVQVSVGGQVVETLDKTFGFRQVEVRGNKLFVNGLEVKLHGVNRHDVHPVLGRTVTPELVEEDVRLFRAANVNFIRTSHYPPREDFLDLCDRYGMYIEDEIAAAFVYQGINPTQNDPDFTAAYMEQFGEMIERDRSHPCIIMWSLGNENYWGRNFQAEYDYARREDPARPLIFSYPITMPEGTRAYDIWSLHYAEYGRDPSDKEDNHSVGLSWGHDAPVLHDEFAHIPCYDLTEQMRDPAVREFWGDSIKRFWESIWNTEGALGGAIWAGIDDCMMTSRGYGAWEWGLYDGWRREKPEYWLTKKAYSPIRVPDEPLANPGQGKPLAVPIQNRFDHTNLNEISIRWAVGGHQGTLNGPDLAPHASGTFEIAARKWQDGDVLNLQFYRLGDLLVDEYNLPIGNASRPLPGPQGPAPRVTEDDGQIVVAGEAFRLAFSKQTGLITKGEYRGSTLIIGGPYVNLVGIELAPWACRSIQARTEGNEAVIDLAGSYGPIEVSFVLRIDGQGLIDTRYTLDRLPVANPRQRKLRVGVDVGGYREVGVSFILAPGIDRLSWERKGLWSAYPEGHIARSKGTAQRERAGGDESYGRQPTWGWADDMRDYALFGTHDVGQRGTNDFRTSKHNIRYASAVLAGSGARVRAESEATDAVRLEILPGANRVDDRDPQIRYVGTWVALDDQPLNYQGTEMMSNKPGDYCEFTFRGTGIAWIGATDMICGQADVYIDGALAASGVDLDSGIGHGISRGEEKVYQQAVWSREGLAEGEHTIRIVVTGHKNPRASNAWVSVDGFLVLGSPAERAVRMNINNAWNYPELTWGNYVKEPIMLSAGYSHHVRVRLTDRDE